MCGVGCTYRVYGGVGCRTQSVVKGVGHRVWCRVWDTECGVGCGAAALSTGCARDVEEIDPRSSREINAWGAGEVSTQQGVKWQLKLGCRV